MFSSKNKISLIVFLIILPIFFLFILTPLSAQDLGSGIVEEAGSSAGLGEGSLPIVLGKIFKIVLSVLGLVALILAIVAGVQWMTSGGNSEKIKKAKALLSAALIGLLIIILAYALVSFIVNKLTGVSGGGGGCTPGSCCADGLRCDENGQCTIADLACSTTFPSENFLLSRGEANFDANNQVYLCSNIRAVFNHNIKSNTVSAALNADALKVVDTDDNNTVEGEWQVAGKFITFTPDEFWEENTSYEMVIPRTISDSNNKYLTGCSAGFLPNGECASTVSEVNWSFETNDQPDDIPPFVDSSYPTKDLINPDRNVSRAPVLEIVFNENIDYTTIIDTNHVDYDADDQSTWHPIAGNFQLCKIANQNTECVVGNKYNNDNLKVSLTSQGFRISLLNAQWLEAFGWYEIKVDGIKDMCGNVMEQSEAWAFQTNDSVPGVQEWWPQGNNVCPDAPIGLRFGTSMYEQEVSVEVINAVTNTIEFAGSIKPSNFPAGGDYRSNLTTGNGSLLVVDDNDDEISNQFKIFQLELNSNLTNDSEYTIEINTDLIIDVDNNTLGKDWSFEVTNLQDCACAPIIYQTLPAQGPRGSCVTVTGYCFNGTLERPATINGFWFDDGDDPDGEISAEIMSSTSNSLTTIIPADFGEPIDDVPDELSERIKIIYEDNGEEVNIPSANQFTVISNQLAQGPCIWRLSPNQGKVSTNFQIKGIRLGSEEGNNYVEMNSWVDHLNIEGAWTNEEIDRVVVPAFSTAGERDVKVAVFDEAEGNYLFSNPASFDVIFDRPQVREFGCNPPPNYSSPGPYKNTQDACTGIDLMVEFTKNMEAYGANGVLNVANYTIRNCGNEENYNPANCNSAYSPTNANFYDSSQNIVQLSLASSLSINTWYQVSIQGNVRSQEEVAMGEDYVWYFKTRDNDLCPVAQIDLTPQNGMITGCSGSQQYTAQPVASNCNFLTASNYTYSWLSSQTGVATVESDQNYQNIAQAIGGGYTWIKVTEDDSQKWTREKLTVNCCSSDQDCYDPDDDSTNRCAGSICDDTYGICTPIISDFSPSAGDLEDWVTINGCWFNNYNQSYSQVSFNEEVASIPFDRCTNSAWQNEQIIAEVPAEQGNPFGNIQVISAPYGVNFEVLSDSNFLEGDSYVGICNLRPDHGPTGLVTTLTTNDNLASKTDQDAVYYGNQRAIVYPEPGWSVPFKEIRSQSPATLPLGKILVKVEQHDFDSNYLSFNVDPTGGQPGDLCIESCGYPCDIGAQFCENSYLCLQYASGICQNCRCCCQVSDPESCGVELECLAGLGDCTGEERGLCCGCENDVQCGSAGCGFLDPHRCCHAHPSVTLDTCSATGYSLTGLNTVFALDFSEPMDQSRMNDDYIKISKNGACGNDPGEYKEDSGRCYLRGEIVSANSEDSNSTIFYPDFCRLTTNQEYKLEFIKGENGEGIRSLQGVSATATGTEACSWDNSLSCVNFVINTATQEQGGFCAIETVNVEPRDFIMKGLNNTHNFLALALDENDEPVCVSSFNWQSENGDIATVSPASGLETVASSIDYGETFIKASAEEISCSLSGDPYTCAKLKVIPTDLPQVVEQQSCDICALGGQSPSPWKNSEENCPNAQIVVRFNRFLELNTINTNSVLVEEFNSTSQNFESINYNSLNEINENSETIVYVDVPLSANQTYRVILKSGLANESGGLKDLSGLPLDGNKNNIQDGSPLDDYVWEFSTGATNCALNQVCVNPRQTTQINHPGNQVYYTDTYASNCNYLEASNFNGNYVWALINQQPANPSQEVAEFISSIDDWQSELSSKHLGEADVEVSINSHPQINDNGHLIVTTVPNIEFSLPQGNEVCRNSIIQIGFDQVMEDDSLNADNLEVWRKYNSSQTGLNCEGGCNGSATSLVGVNYPENFLASLYFKIKNIFNFSAEAQVAEDCWCQWPLSGISLSIDENNKSLARLDAGLLNGEAQYKVVIKSEVESQYGIDLGTDNEWEFTTKELCELTRAEISPENVYFNSAGLLENLDAQAFDAQGNEIFGVTGYNWDWNWQSSQPTIVEVNPESEVPENAEIVSGRQDGSSQIIATAQLNVGGEPIDFSVSDQILAQVSICEHPWIYFDNGGTNNTNFSLFYCRDQDPLLPKLLYKGGEVAPSGCGDGILQSFEVCDLYVGEIPTHATCSFNCLSWECDVGYYKDNDECLPNIPLAPSNLEVEVDNDFPYSQINLSWNDNSNNEEFFKVERKVSGANWGQIKEVESNVNFYNDSGLGLATKYYYRVRAGNISGDSAYTTENWAITLCQDNQCYFNQTCYNSEQCQPHSTQMCLNGEWINTCGDGELDSNCSEICDGIVGNIPGQNTHCQSDCLGWTCDTGYGNCDSNPSNGCETNLLIDDQNCGECNSVCKDNQSCDNGVCVCYPGWGDCDGDSSNGCEIYLLNSNENCGICGHQCSGDQRCDLGDCVDLSGGRGNCNPECGNYQYCDDSNNCVCDPGYGDCDSDPNNGCETNLLIDDQNCGECNKPCLSGQNCNLGNCGNCIPPCGNHQYCDDSDNCACDSGYGDCDGNPNNGCETNLLTNNNHCGECNSVCKNNQSCDSGSCVCSSGWGDCDGNPNNGCETNLLTNNSHCGGCNTVCGTNQHCSDSSCVCSSGWGDCDGNPNNGCEIDLLTNNNHCGECNTVCGTNQHCSDSSCVCSSGYDYCDGDCVNLSTNNNHCGGCNTVCGTNQHCSDSSCVCSSGWGDCDGNPNNGCEIDLLTNNNHCGECNNACDSGYDCTNGSCPFCGDDTINGDEECDDGSNNNGTVCSTSYGGTCVYCNTACEEEIFVGPFCGDDTINGDEECDGSNLGGQSCSSFSEFWGGSLICAGCNFNTNFCFSGNPCTNYPANYIGEGTSSNPYKISSCLDLQCMSKDLNAHYMLMDNIDCSATNPNDDDNPGSAWDQAQSDSYGYGGKGFQPVGSLSNHFAGNLNGDGHYVSDLYIDRDTQNYVGLIGYADDGVIKNIGLENIDVSGDNRVGGLVGRNFNATITNSYATGDVSGGGAYVGGLMGHNYNGAITNSYATGSVSGGDNIGGLVGYSHHGASTITNSYATGSVSGDDNIGGLVGFLWFGTITNSYATGSVSGDDDIGGLVGDNNYGTITNSYWNTETSGQSSSAGGTGRTTDQMTYVFDSNTYQNWDFDDSIWKAVSGYSNNDYPCLAWQEDNTCPRPPNYCTVHDYIGEGTSSNPYKISSCLDLQCMSKDSNAHYMLMDNIDCSATNPNDGDNPGSIWDDENAVSSGYLGYGYDGKGFQPVGDYPLNSFTGNLNGNGHYVSNLYIDRDTQSYVGLIGYADDGVIKNIGLENIDVSGDNRVGGLVGRNLHSTITNSYATGSVSGGDNIGGLVGYSFYSTITNSYATGSVSGDDSVGGLVGRNYHATITNSYATGDVSGNNLVGGLVGRNLHSTITNSYATGSVSGGDYVGGLMGYNGAGTITNSYATGSVSGNDRVGGLVGSFHATITNSYATGDVSGNNLVGGLVGYSHGGTITNSYATGDVSGNRSVGGLVGTSSDGTITNSYATGSVGGNYQVGGLVGFLWFSTITNSYWNTETSGQSSSAGGTGRTTDQMTYVFDSSTYQNWNFDDSIWKAVGYSNGDYPCLAWQEDNTCP